MQLVMIDIADENDNPPYFKHNFYKAGETTGFSWFVASYCMSRMFPLLITQQPAVAPRSVPTIFTSSKPKGDCHQSVSQCTYANSYS